MRVRSGLVICLTGALAAGVVPVGAQSRGAAPQPVAGAIKASWDAAKKNIRDSADVMPEANYSFKPVDTVRTFGQIVAHVAGANYVFCSAIKGEKSPQAEDAFEGLATKAAIVKAWDESVTYCDAAYAAATDRTLAEAIQQPFGTDKGPRATALMGNVGHLNEHYGNLVTYLRMKGIVPPTSRR